MKEPHNFSTPPSPDLWQARTLIALFLDGGTSDEQEKWLADFYLGHAPGTLPDDLESARRMFAWYASLPPSREGSTRGSRGIIPRVLMAVAAACVALVAVVSGVVYFRHDSTPEHAGPWASYSGSYIIRNGEQVDDIEIIYPELVAGEHLADSICDDSAMIEQAIGHIDDPELIDYIRTQIFHCQ